MPLGVGLAAGFLVGVCFALFATLGTIARQRRVIDRLKDLRDLHAVAANRYRAR